MIPASQTNRWRATALACLLAPCLAGAQEPDQEIDPFADTHLSWREITELGGLAVGEPYRDRTRKWILAVDCNVAGAREITAKPTRTDPAMAVRRVSSAIDGDRIYLRVLAAEPREGKPDPECRGAFLGYPHAGQYQIFYRDPTGEARPLGRAVVPEYPLEIPGRPLR